MVTNKEIAQACIKAVPYLNLNEKWDGADYICHAISAGDTNNESYYPKSEAASKAVEIIEMRLGHEYFDTLTLEEWLHKNGVPPYEITYKKMQAHRLAWLNMLIEEFSTD